MARFLGTEEERFKADIEAVDTHRAKPTMASLPRKSSQEQINNRSISPLPRNMAAGPAGVGLGQSVGPIVISPMDRPETVVQPSFNVGWEAQAKNSPLSKVVNYDENDEQGKG